MNESTTPLLSIVIPTKNRYSTLTRVVKYILSFESRDFEIVVSDNSTEDELGRKAIEEINDDRFHYHFVEESLSQTGNSNFVVSKANGKYICFIGDDDMVSESILAICQWLSNNQVQGAICPVAEYYWPGQKTSAIDSNVKGNLFLKKNYTLKVKKIDVQAERRKVLRWGGVRMHNLPKAYHGIVSKEAMDQVKELFGSYFPGPSPDMANAFALSTVLTSLISVDYPFMISGTSSKSVAGRGVVREHVGKLEDQAHLPSGVLEHWNPNIPMHWTGPTIYAQSVYEVLRLSKDHNESNEERLNFKFLYAWLLVFFPSQRAALFSGNLIHKFDFNIFKYQIYIFFLRAKHFIMRYFVTEKKRFDHVESIADAAERINSVVVFKNL